MTTNETTKTSPTDVFGYSAAFKEALAAIGQISPEEFAQRYPTQAEYLSQISFDPTTAQFWTDYRNSSFSLDPAELEIFQRHGFVVSDRLGRESFGDLFLQIYNRDLPVFVSADALLHAWHRSYDAILEELEELCFIPLLNEILSGMAEQIPAARSAYGDGILGESVRDADYFLTVARSLLAVEIHDRIRLDNRGRHASGSDVDVFQFIVPSHLGCEDRVAQTLQAIKSLELQEFNLFGRDRSVDFSQFKVRGHYENSAALQCYFRAMMWCGRIDLRIAGNPEESSPQELGSAIVLHDLLRRSGKLDRWQQFDRLLQTFVGRTDSMTFGQLDALLDAAGVDSPTQIKDLTALKELQSQIARTSLGVQQISSHVYVSPFGAQKQELPRSFTLMGQKFTLDSWVLGQVVFDRIEWDGEKVMRRVPSCLDVAFAVFGNNQVVPELVEREFRDGLNYQHNLAAARDTVDAQDPAIWSDNLYLAWLATLRELSTSTTQTEYPEAMRTQAWAMKTLNTQLASWTQLRHDTILYVQQSYTNVYRCYYPAGFVEPRPAFWERFEQMAQLAANLMEQTPFPDLPIDKYAGWHGQSHLKNVRQLSEVLVEFFENFAQQLATLKGIATKHLSQEPLSKEENRFLKKIVREIVFGSGTPVLDGWYLKLFYRKLDDCWADDAIVADVHTNPPTPDFGDPGCVLHQGVGKVDLLTIAVDSGTDKMVFAGPVLSHYEFQMPGVTRKSDSEWKEDLARGKQPPRPQWTQQYINGNTSSD